MSFRQAGSFRIEVSKYDDGGKQDYRFIMYIKQCPLIMVPVNIISHTDDNILFEFNISHNNIMMETGNYRIGLQNGMLTLFKKIKDEFNDVFITTAPCILNSHTIKAGFTVLGKDATMGVKPKPDLTLN